jgi:hypothetical protein
VHVTFPMLEILASRPDGRGTFDDVLQEIMSTKNHDGSKRFAELDNVDPLQAGLVLDQDGQLTITEAGRSVLRALEAFEKFAKETKKVRESQSLQGNDDLVGEEIRQKIFNLDLRDSMIAADASSTQECDAEELVDQTHDHPIAPQEHRETEPINEKAHRAPVGEPDSEAPAVPSFLKRAPLVVYQTPRSGSRTAKRPSLTVDKLKRFGRILRGHVEQHTPNVKFGSAGGGVVGLVLSILVVLVIVICVGAFIAINQIKSLKSEISGLEKHLLPLKNQALAEQQDKKSHTGQKVSPSIVDDAGKLSEGNRPAPAPLVLSPDDVRLIKEYIKPAPFIGGAAVKPISVGDSVTLESIPLPTPLTERIPKLIGARFTIYNGAIIIMTRNSHQADAVLKSN